MIDWHLFDKTFLYFANTYKAPPKTADAQPYTNEDWQWYKWYQQDSPEESDANTSNTKHKFFSHA